jgi:hypothetical protein
VNYFTRPRSGGNYNYFWINVYQTAHRDFGAHNPVTSMNLLSDRSDIKVEYKCWDPPLPSTLCSIAPPDLKAGGAILGTCNTWTSEQPQTAIAATALVPTADLRSASTADPLFYRILPPAMIMFGLGLTAAWACLLVYGLVSITLLP